MDIAGYFNSEIFNWIILPLLIFLARICDQAIGTIRIILVSRGAKLISSLLGFFEILVYVIALGQIMQHIDSPLYYISYAAGFAAGNYIGAYIEEKLALGIVLIQLISEKDPTPLIKSLKANNYGFTNIHSKDAFTEENLILIVVYRKEINHVLKLINEFNPKAFYSIEDVRTVNEGLYPLKKTHSKIFSTLSRIKTFFALNPHEKNIEAENKSDDLNK